MGGMDIEEVAAHPARTASRAVHIDPLIGFQPHHARWLAYRAGIDAEAMQRRRRRSSAGSTTRFVALDAMLVEINPLVLTRTAACSRSTPR